MRNERASDGDWIDGLARAFLCAGTKSVVCTLQRLDDRAAASLVTDLYQVIREDEAMPRTRGGDAEYAQEKPPRRRADVASALRRVKLPNLEFRRYAHPANWSAIVYFGLPGQGDEQDPTKG